MISSAMSIVLAAALLFQCYTGSMTASLSSDREAFGNDEIAENAVGTAETAFLGRNGGGAKLIVVADAGLWRNLWANEGLLNPYKQRAGADSGLTMQRRDVSEQDRFVVIRKDAMRCMVGRVYRPCWEMEQ